MLKKRLRTLKQVLKENFYKFKGEKCHERFRTLKEVLKENFYKLKEENAKKKV